MNYEQARLLAHAYQTIGPAMRLFARQRLRSDQADDAVQDVFCRLAGQRKLPASLRAWLFRALRNETITRWRKAGRRSAGLSARTADLSPDWFEPDPTTPIDAAAAQTALSGLDQELREVIVLRIWGQMTLREVAVLVGCSVSTIHGRYQTALDELRKRMKASCPTNPN